MIHLLNYFWFGFGSYSFGYDLVHSKIKNLKISEIFLVLTPSLFWFVFLQLIHIIQFKYWIFWIKY